MSKLTTSFKPVLLVLAVGVRKSSSTQTSQFASSWVMRCFSPVLTKTPQLPTTFPFSRPRCFKRLAMLPSCDAARRRSARNQQAVSGNPSRRQAGPATKPAGSSNLQDVQTVRMAGEYDGMGVTPIYDTQSW